MSFMMTPLMAAEILVAEFMVARHFAKRSLFWLRIICSCVLCLFFTVWIEVLYSVITGSAFEYGTSSEPAGIGFKIVYYFVIFAMTMICIGVSFKQSFAVVMVCGTLGYAIQHFTFSLASEVTFLLSEYANISGNIPDLIIWLATRLAVYVPMYFLLSRRRFEDEFYRGNNRMKILLCLIVIIVCICLSRLINDDPDRSVFSSISGPLYAMICSAFVVLTQFSMARDDANQKKLYDMSELLHKEREQYAMSKETIEIINEKCHDLKHQIALVREDSSERNISEIEDAVMIYDCTVKTGNDVIDILLTEKKLQCESHNIKFTTVVNGQLLNFMSDMDIYALLGNAISNAIDAVSGLEDESRRHISLRVRQIGTMCSIHIENYYEGEIEFMNGLPKTTKDEMWHGFGMKSMERIVSFYNGTMTIGTENHVFALDMLFPAGAQPEAA